MARLQGCRDINARAQFSKESTGHLFVETETRRQLHEQNAEFVTKACYFGRETIKQRIAVHESGLVGNRFRRFHREAKIGGRRPGPAFVGLALMRPVK